MTESGNPASSPSSRSMDAFRAFASFGMLWRSIMQSLPKSETMAGLHGPQLVLLLHLAHSPALSMRELAEAAHTSSANLTGIIDRLVERGLVERVRSEEDRRVILVQLTEKGGAEHDAMEQALARRLGEVASTLTPEELAEFARIAQKMLEAAGVESVRTYDPDKAHIWRKRAAG